MFNGSGNRLGPGCDIELGKDAFDMESDRTLGPPHYLGDFPISLTLLDPVQNR